MITAEACRLTERAVQRFAQLRLGDQDIAATRRGWLPVFPEGTFDHPEYGELRFDETTIPEFIENFRSQVRHIQPCVDVDHRNEQAAGWIVDLEWRYGDGLYALIEWNQLGVGLLLDKQYRYASAQFGDYVDEETGAVYRNVLSAVTLTNFPFLKRLPAIQLSEASAMTSTEVRAAKRAHDQLLKFGDRVLSDGLAPIAGGALSRRAFRYARQHGLNWLDPDDKLIAFDAMTQLTEVDQGMQVRCSNCSKALDDGDLDAGECGRCGAAVARLDDEEASEGYDSDDVWGEGPMSKYAPRSAQPNRSDGRTTTPVLPSRRSAVAAHEHRRGVRLVEPETGRSTVAQARRYAHRHGLNWKEPGQRLAAFTAVTK